MNDMSAVIIPKSDQLNSDSLLAGPITITITEVSIRPGTEQPVTVHYEGEDGKPWKPCKSMCKVMVTCWDKDANQYIGRSLTLWNDPKVKWGGLAVGGIRITHMSHIDAPRTMALTETKGSKKPFTVKPLVTQQDTAAVEQAVLLADARKSAALGVAAYQTFWKGLNKGKQAFLLPQHEELKATAKAVDEATSKPEDDNPFATKEPPASEEIFPGDLP
jgi:hypothetical protein